jgi:hypothetical protein
MERPALVKSFFDASDKPSSENLGIKPGGSVLSLDLSELLDELKFRL